MRRALLVLLAATAAGCGASEPAPVACADFRWRPALWRDDSGDGRRDAMLRDAERCRFFVGRGPRFVRQRLGTRDPEEGSPAEWLYLTNEDCADGGPSDGGSMTLQFGPDRRVQRVFCG